MKRSGMPPRKSYLQRKTRLKQRNEERIARRAARYKAALSSPHWRAMRKLAFARSGGVCECGCGQPLGPRWTLNHLTYARLGRELPEDVEALTKACNAKYEMEKRGWKHRQRTR